MKIRRLRLESYRGVEQCEVRFAAPGVTVVVGPNEVGKSSLAEAIGVLFDYMCESKHRDVVAIKPVHKDAGTSIEIELESGPYELTYLKRYHREKQTSLRVVRPKPENLTGREAHERAIAILDETLDRSLWKALQVAQGRSPQAADLTGQKWLSQALDRGAGAARGGDAEENLFEESRAEFLKYYTDTGKERKELVDGEAELQRMRAERDACQSLLREIEGDVEQSARLQSELRRLRFDLQGDTQRLEALRADVHKIEALETGVSKCKAEHERSLRLEQEIRTDQQTRAELVLALSGASAEHRRFAAELEEAEPALRAAREDKEAATRERDALEATLRSARARTRIRGEDVEYWNDLLHLEQLGERRERLIEMERRAAEATARLEVIAVDDGKLAALRAASSDVDMARARARIAGPRVRLRALSDLAAQIDDAEERLNPGEERDLVVVRSLSLRVPDLFELSVHPGIDARATTEALEQTEKKLRVLLDETQVADVASAEALNDERKTCQRVLDEVPRTTKECLRDLERSELDEKFARLGARTSAFPERRASESPPAGDLSEARRLHESAQRDENRALEAVDAAAARANRESERLAKLEGEHGKILGKLELSRSRERDSATRLAIARATEPDEALASRLRAASDAAAEVGRRLDAAGRDLAELQPEETRDKAANAERVVDSARVRIVALAEQETRVQADLRAHGEDGLREKLEGSERRIERSEREQARLLARAAAAKLLHDVLREERDAARRAYVAPLKSEIDRLGRYVFGPSFEVTLDDEDLSIQSRTLSGRTIPFDSLSTGAKEQLGLITRLACALIVAKDGGVPLVLDDVLGHTDPGRLESMGAVLALAGKECQIILLTCSPERYRHVGGATIVSI